MNLNRHNELKHVKILKYIWYIIHFKYSMWINWILYIEIKIIGQNMIYSKFFILF
jgi:hypothetical protein